MARRARSSENNDEPKSKKIDPIVEGLFARLPKSGTYWSEENRSTWLKLIEAAFKVIYKDEPDDEPAA